MKEESEQKQTVSQPEATVAETNTKLRSGGSHSNGSRKYNQVNDSGFQVERFLLRKKKTLIGHFDC